MRCAVVTPYHTEPLSMLRRAHDSVRSQGVAVTHVLVADGHPREELDSWDAVHLRLPTSHGDNGNTPAPLAPGGPSPRASTRSRSWMRTTGTSRGTWPACRPWQQRPRQTC